MRNFYHNTSQEMNFSSKWWIFITSIKATMTNFLQCDAFYHNKVLSSQRWIFITMIEYYWLNALQIWNCNTIRFSSQHGNSIKIWNFHCNEEFCTQIWNFHRDIEFTSQCEILTKTLTFHYNNEFKQVKASHFNISLLYSIHDLLQFK